MFDIQHSLAPLPWCYNTYFSVSQVYWSKFHVGEPPEKMVIGTIWDLGHSPKLYHLQIPKKTFCCCYTPPPLLLGLWDRFCWRLHFNLKRCYLLLLPLLSGVLQSGVFCHSIADVGSLGNCTPGDTL